MIPEEIEFDYKVAEETIWEELDFDYPFEDEE